MSRFLRRREVLQTNIATSTIAITGCMGALPGSDGDVVVRNQDNVTHEITITFNRGSPYPLKTDSVTVQAEKQNRIQNLISTNDAPYPFNLKISLDGSYVATTHHELQGETVTVAIQEGGKVTADKTDTDVTITPVGKRQNESE